MARLAISSAAALGGTLIGIGPSYGWLAGSLLGNLFLGPRSQTHEGPQLKDYAANHATYGSLIPIVFGSYRLPCRVIWSSDLLESKNSTVDRGKGHKLTSSYYTYSCSFAVAIGEGPIDKVLKIWANDELIYDTTNGCISKYELPIRIYQGTEDQQADQTIESYEGVSRTPAFRGLSYLVFEDFPLADFGNKLPLIECEVATQTKRTFQHTKLDLKPLQHDNTVLSQRLPYLYHAHGGKLSQVNRYDLTLSLQQDVHELLPENSLLVGRIALDPASDDIYSCVERSNATYLACFKGEDLSLKHHNYGPGKSWSHETLPFVTRQDVWTADPFLGQITCYSKTNLSVKFTVKVAKDKCSVLCNFTEDDEGNVWFLSTGKEPSAGLMLTKLSSSGHHQFHPFDGYGSGHGIAYDCLSKSLIVGTDGHVLRVNLVNGQILQATQLKLSQLYAQSSWVSQARIRGKLLLKCGTKILCFDVQTFAVTEQIDSAVQWGVDLKGMTYDPLRGGVWTTDGCLNLVTFETYQAEPVTLSAICAALCRRVGLHQKDVDCDDLKTKVRGYALGRSLSARQVLATMASLFFFEAQEKSDQLVFFRPYTQKKMIPIDENEFCIGSERADVKTYIDPIENIPQSLSISYLNPLNGYEPGLQRAVAPHGSSTAQHTENRSVSVVLTDDEAMAIAETTLRVLEAGRFRFSFMLPPKYAFLRKGDLLSLTLKGQKEIVLITSLSIGANTLLEVGATRLALISEMESKGVPSRFADQKLYPQGPTKLVIIDTPPLFEGDPEGGFYVAALGTMPKWRGAHLYLTSEKDHKLLTTIGPDREAVLGKLLSDLPKDMNDQSIIKIKFSKKVDLSSLSSEDDDEENLVLIGQEVLQFCTAKQLDDDTWELTKLRRGIKGTESNVKAHNKGEKIVLLNQDYLIYIPDSKALRKAQFLRGVTLGKGFDTGVDYVLPKPKTINQERKQND